MQSWSEEHCDSFLNTPLLEDDKTKPSITENMISFLSHLLKEQIIGTEYLTTLIHDINVASVITNPFSATITQSSQGIYKPLVDEYIAQSQIDRDQIKNWAKTALREIKVIQQKKENAVQETKLKITRAIFNYIPGGNFIHTIDNSSKKITIPISDFEMMQTPVTQWVWAQLKALMGYREPYELVPSTFIDGPESISINISGVNLQMRPDNPVEYIDLDDCIQFTKDLQKLSNSKDSKIQKILQKIFPGHQPGDIYDLPDMFQILYVGSVRGTLTKAYWDEKIKSAEILEYGWFRNNSQLSTHPVAIKLPLMFDTMAFYEYIGNVSVWTKSSHDEYVELLEAHKIAGPRRGGRTTYFTAGFAYSDGYRMAYSQLPLTRTPETKLDTLGLRLVRKRQLF